MFLTLVEKELKYLLLSPKFTATFLACTVLTLLSIQAGIMEYNNGRAQYDAATALVTQELNEAERWHQVGGRQRVFREPNPVQIFVSGVHFDIGRYSVISSWQDIKLRQSAYSIEPLFAVFRSIDFLFIVQVVLSLLTIVFSYDLISGEKESGTLRLMLSNAVPRTTYIAAKLSGAWLGLMVPLLIPLALGILLIMIQRIPFTPDDWMHIAALAGYAALYLTAFLSVGLLVSTLTHQSNLSFLILLVFWILMVLVIPRGGMMIASQLYDVPSATEIESQKEGFAQEQRTQFFEKISEAARERSQATAGMTPEEREKYNEENEWDQMLSSENDQKAMDEAIAEYNRKVEEDAANKRQEQQRFGFMLSRFSPASAFQLAGMTLGQTDIDLKQRYLTALSDYRSTFRAYISEKSPSGGIIMGGQPSPEDKPDLTDMPQSTTPELANPISQTLPDALILFLFTAVATVMSFVTFNRYDVR